MLKEDACCGAGVHAHGESHWMPSWLRPEHHITPMQSAEEELWVLKEDAHRGAGVHVLPVAAAVREARGRGRHGGPTGAAGGPSAGAGGGSYDMVQQYVRDQLTIDGRKFYVRCWSLAGPFM